MKSIKFFLFLFFFSPLCRAQLINCPNNSVYILTGGQIIEQPLPLPAAAITLQSSLPNLPGGLAIGPSLGFPAPNPTFWTVSGGMYWYYNGVIWVNTNHTTGNPAALNIGGGGSCLYNLVGGTGQIYIYDGTTNGSLLTTVTGFSGGGPYDIGADANDNFYLVKATTPNPSLVIYNRTGVPICSYSLSNLPTVSNGGGFAIINNLIAVYNSGFSMGNINPASPQITFTAQAPIISPNDFANCVIPVPTGQILAPLGGVLDCFNNTLPLIAQIIPGGIGMYPGSPSSMLTSCNYTWSGPGILSGQGTPSVVVNQPGVYTFSVCSNGCPAQPVVKSFVVTSAGLALTPTISAPACFSGSTTLSVSVNTGSVSIFWTGPGISGPSNAATVNINSPGVYTVTVTNILGCFGAKTVNVQSSPAVSISVSSNTICAQGSNGSPNSFTLTPSGASVYMLLTSSNCSFNSPGSGSWVCFPVGLPQSSTSLGSATVIGSNGVCTGSAITGFSIIPNPTISITPSVSSVCNGFSKSLSISGASNYSWLPGLGLNLFSTANVIINTTLTTVYSAYGSSLGCNSSTQSSTINVLPIPTVFANPPSTTVCIGNNTTLSASGTATSFTWNSSGGPSALTVSNLNINSFSSTTWTVVGALNTCTNSATATVATVPPPVLSMVFNTNTVCAQPVNGSPNSINVTPFGAINYTLLSGSNFNVTSPFGSSMTIFPTGVAQTGISIATVTLLGSNGYCQVGTAQSFSIIPNPVITSVPATAIICPGEGILLMAYGANNYSWLASSGTLNNYSGNSVIANPNVTTVYSVIGESLGCMSVAKVNIINISPVPNISVNAASPTLCVGSSVLLNATGNASSYHWLQANGLAASVGASVFATPSVSQTYTVIGQLNNCTSSGVISLSVIPSPTLAVSASAYTVCSGSNIRLYVNGAITYNWSPSTSANSTYGENIVAVPTSNTTFTVRGFNGICIGSATVFVKTVSNPNVQLDVPYNQLCAGGSVPLSASGAQNFIWSPAGSLSSGVGPTVFARPAITTNYTVMGINSEGEVSCAQEVYYTLTVLPNAKAIVGSSKSICLGDNIYLTASGGDTYVWNPTNSLNKTSGPSVIAHPTISTVYYVESSFNGNCAATNTIAVSVNPKPWVNAGRDTVYNLDEVITINATGAGALKWISGENILCSDCPLTQILPKTNNCYRVEATNEFGCKAEDEVCITLTDNFYEYIPNSFTPNNDGLNDLFLIYGTGISNITMDIYDRWGEHLFSSNDQTNGWNGTYKGIECKTGVYTYKITYKGLSGKNIEKVGAVTVLR